MNAPLVPLTCDRILERRAGSFPVSVSRRERHTSKINFPFEFAGVQTIRSKRRVGTNICPDCPDGDCNKCPNDCAMCGGLLNLQYELVGTYVGGVCISAGGWRFCAIVIIVLISTS